MCKNHSQETNLQENVKGLALFIHIFASSDYLIVSQMIEISAELSKWSQWWPHGLIFYTEKVAASVEGSRFSIFQAKS